MRVAALLTLVPCSTPDVLWIICEKMYLVETRGKGVDKAFPACPLSHV